LLGEDGGLDAEMLIRGSHTELIEEHVTELFGVILTGMDEEMLRVPVELGDQSR
jgi:hypothetical protein